MNHPFQLIRASDYAGLAQTQKIVKIANDADALAEGAELRSSDVVELHFPSFVDGRAFSQAVQLRKRLGFQGEIRATGDVLIDQLLQMRRSGFSSAVLREDQDLHHAQKLLAMYPAFYQRDAHPQGHPHEQAPAPSSLAPTASPACPASSALPSSAPASSPHNTAAHPGSRAAVARHARASEQYAAKLAATQALLRDVCQRYQPLTQASSLGVEDMVITHLLDALALPCEVFVLQTGRLHRQTLDLLDTMQRHYGGAARPARVIRIYEPFAAAVTQFEAAHGAYAMRESLSLRKQCCDIRKMQPLALALAGQRAWLTGLRKEQSDERANIAAIDLQASPIKINPLHDWSLGDVWHYVRTHNVIYNPLHDAFYPSIGCEPCTRAVALGEDSRAGRWWWEGSSAKECGLHWQHENQGQG